MTTFYDNNLVTYNDLIFDNVKTTEPQYKSFDNGSGYRSEISYKYPSKEDRFKVELCEVMCSSIRKGDNDKDKKKSDQNKNQNQRESYYVNVTLNCFGDRDWKKNVTQEKVDNGLVTKEEYEEILNIRKNGDQNARDCAQKLDDLHVHFAKFFYQYRTKWDHRGLQYSSSNAADESGFKPLLVWAKDDNTGDRLENTKINPHKFFNLMWGTTKDGIKYHTRFYDQNAKEIPWEVLKISDFTGYPVIHYRTSWGNDRKLSIQATLVTFLVTGIWKREFQISQQARINEINASRPLAANMLDADIAELAGLVSATLPEESSDNNTYNEATDTSGELTDAPGIQNELEQLNKQKNLSQSQIQVNQTGTPLQQNVQVNLPSTLNSTQPPQVNDPPNTLQQPSSQTNSQGSPQHVITPTSVANMQTPTQYVGQGMTHSLPQQVQTYPGQAPLQNPMQSSNLQSFITQQMGPPQGYNPAYSAQP